jgi:hypothetical protein
MFCLPPAPGLYGMAPKLLLRIFLKCSKSVDFPFDHALSRWQQNPHCLSLFCVMPDVLERSGGCMDLGGPYAAPF